MNVALDEVTHDRLLGLCDELGVTVSALVEAFGRAATGSVRPRWLGGLVVEARRVAAERRRRRPT